LYCLLELYICNKYNDNIIKQHNAYKKIRNQHIDMLTQSYSLINDNNMTPQQCVDYILNTGKKKPQIKNVKSKTDNSEPKKSVAKNTNKSVTPAQVLFQCSFCNKKDETFNEEGLDLHFWKECPMLCQCQFCDQVIEVSTLTEHLLTECASGVKFVKCNNCKFA